MKTTWEKVQNYYNRHSVPFIMIVFGMYLLFTVFSSGYNPNPDTFLLKGIKLFFDAGRTITYGLAALLFGLNILFVKKYRIQAIILGAFFALLYYITRSKEILIFGILGLDAAMVDFKYSMKTYQKVTITAIALVVLFSRFKIFNNALFDPDRLRVGLGFYWSNMCIFMTTIWTTVMIWIKSPKIRKDTLYFMMFILIILFSAQDARIVFLIGMLVLVLTLFLKVYRNGWLYRFFRTSFFKWLFVTLPVLLCTLAFLMTLCYGLNPEGLHKLDMFMSDRLSYAWQGMETFGLTLFGQNIEWVGFSLTPSPLPYNFVDSSYIRITLNYGIVFLIFILAVLCRTNYLVFQSGNVYHCIILAAMQMLYFNEAWLISLMYNPYMILVLQNCMNDMDMGWKHLKIWLTERKEPKEQDEQEIKVQEEQEPNVKDEHEKFVKGENEADIQDKYEAKIENTIQSELSV